MVVLAVEHTAVAAVSLLDPMEETVVCFVEKKWKRSDVWNNRHAKVLVVVVRDRKPNAEHYLMASVSTSTTSVPIEGMLQVVLLQL